MGNTTSSTSDASPWAPTQGGLKTGISDLTSLYESGGLQVNPYEGDWVADATQATTDAQSGILGAVSGLTGSANGAMDVLNSITAPGAFDAQKQSVIDTIMPSINSSFAGSGMTGSSLHQQNLTQGLTKGMADAEQGFMQTQMQAAGMIPGMMDAQLSPYMAALGVGQQQQAQNQAEIDATIQKDLMSQGSEGQAISDFLSMLSGVGGQFGTQTSTQQQSSGPLSILGGGLQLASMFSDERVKTGIKQVGALFDGTPVYTYQYANGFAPDGLNGVTFMGVMAQDVEHTGAVEHGDPSGFMRVNYGAL